MAVVTSFLSFLQLRIADEFKDFDEDSRYRPYRPVPRGLVTLPPSMIFIALRFIVSPEPLPAILRLLSELVRKLLT